MGVSSHHDAIPTPLMTNTVRIRRGVSAAKDEVGLKRAAAPASLPSGAHQVNTTDPVPGELGSRICNHPSSATRGCRMAQSMGPRNITTFRSL
jgi:hypothetical protein